MKKILKIFILLLIPALLITFAIIWRYRPILITRIFQNQEISRNYYREARQLQLNNDFKSAYYTYGKISPKYKIYDVVLYQQGNCAAAIEDEKTAIEKYKKILKLYPKSPVAPLASYNLGQAYIRAEKPLEAEKQFLSTVKDFPHTDFEVGSFYYLGELYKYKNKDLAAQYWIKYIALAPGGKFALNCYESLKSLNYTFSQKEKYLAGIALFMQQKYKKSLEYLNQLPRKETWYYRAICYKFLGRRRDAVSVIINGLTKYPDDNISESKIINAMNTYVQLNRSTKYRSWSNILRWTNKEKDFVLYNKAKFLSFKRARKIYEQIYYNYPTGNYASEALWNLFWYEYDKGNYSRAIKLGQKHIAAYENTNASPAVYFWLGKIYEKEKNISRAKDFYKYVLKWFPDSYYAFRANGRIAAIKGKKDTAWQTDRKNKLPVNLKKARLPYSYEKISAKHNIQTAELVFLGDYDTAQLFMSKDLFLESWIKLQNGMYTSSIVSARKGMRSVLIKPDRKKPQWKLIYPIYYAQKINKNADLNGLDPVLVLALIKEESHFNPFAVSSSNARGLMQVLPVTARDIARWKRLRYFKYNELFDPEINIQIGTAYVGFTADTFGGNMLLAVAAYNAGPVAVQEWLKKLSNKDMDRFVENIPYNQTRRYVKKVFGTYWNYRRIYGF